MQARFVDPSFNALDNTHPSFTSREGERLQWDGQECGEPVTTLERLTVVPQ